VAFARFFESARIKMNLPKATKPIELPSVELRTRKNPLARVFSFLLGDH
jgi:hypothetical protein